MQNNKISHEIKGNDDESKSSDLFFGLTNLGVNTTKENNRNGSRIKEDIKKHD